MRKKRVLLVNEASCIKSGFATYGYELMSRLYKTGKYDLAELACSVGIHDARMEDIPWKVYPNNVNSQDPRYQIYQNDEPNKYGAWRFERVCLDFQPDVVMTIRDPWMDIFITKSPFRDFFNWVWLCTVDSAPQNNDWIDSFTTCDGVMTYSQWGYDVLKKQSNNRIPLYGVASPGTNTDIFKPVPDKKQHKKYMGLDEDCYIVGTIMRNQKRKLYPDLMIAFNKFLEICKSKNPELAKKTFLYLHTAYPDVGWDIPSLIKEHGLGSKILVTYICQFCKKPFLSFFRDAITSCPHCARIGGFMPNVNLGLSQQDLAQVISLFDVYVQYSICEGFGIPLVEAASCGVPVMAVDYSAMSDVGRKLNGYMINVAHTFREVETGADRVYPDNDHFAEVLYKYLISPDVAKNVKAEKTKKAAEKYYDWNKNIKIWEEYIDNAAPPKKKWNSPPRIFTPATHIPQIESNHDFVNWCLVNIAGNPDLVNSYMGLTLINSLDYGLIQASTNKMIKFDRNNIINFCKKYVENSNISEQYRTGILPLENDDFIEYANRK